MAIVQPTENGTKEEKLLYQVLGIPFTEKLVHSKESRVVEIASVFLQRGYLLGHSDGTYPRTTLRHEAIPLLFLGIFRANDQGNPRIT